MITDNPSHPDLKKEESGKQNKIYLVLPDSERAKGFVRPYRDSYIHVGREVLIYEELNFGCSLKKLTKENTERYKEFNWTYEIHYSENYKKFKNSNAVSRFVEAQEMVAFLHNKKRYGVNCGCVTKMNPKIAETYARNPSFYGLTWCMRCAKHLPVGEFIWDEVSGQTVGS